MARLFKRGKYWWYQFRGHRYSTRCTDRKAAEASARDIERRVADPTYHPPNETTLGGALTEYLENRRVAGRSPETLRMLSAHIGHAVRLLGEDTQLGAVDSNEIDRYTSTRLKEGASRSTVGKERSTLRGTLGLARRHRKYPFALDEAFGEFELNYEPIRRKLTADELTKLLAVLEPERAAQCAFIVATSADHPKSCEAALPEDIDLKAWRVLVRGTKNKYRHRTVSVVFPLFRKLLKLAAPFVPFKRWTNAVRDLTAACKRAKVPRVTPRDLRRTHGHLLHSAGVAANLIAPGMGHADSKMVEVIYGKLDTDDVERLLKRKVGRGTAEAHRGAHKKRAPRKGRQNND